jgi:plastocyanin
MRGLRGTPAWRGMLSSLLVVFTECGYEPTLVTYSRYLDCVLCNQITAEGKNTGEASGTGCGNWIAGAPGELTEMRPRKLLALLALATIALSAGAQSITGTILIKKKLTRRSVTAAIPVYQRGTTVALGKDGDDEDPLAKERARVVIYLEGPKVAGMGVADAGAAGAAPAAPLQVEQLNRRFLPDMVVIPAGSTVTFPNMDPIFHNIFSLSKAKSFDLGNYDKGETRSVVFSKPGIVEVYCHLHPNMAATVVVTPNRWYARVDRSGQYQIPDVPPGQYTVVAWHKAAGFFRKTITVEPGQNAVADFFIPLEAESKPETADKKSAGQESSRQDNTSGGASR